MSHLDSTILLHKIRVIQLVPKTLLPAILYFVMYFIISVLLVSHIDVGNEVLDMTKNYTRQKSLCLKSVEQILNFCCSQVQHDLG